MIRVDEDRESNFNIVLHDREIDDREIEERKKER